MSKTKMPIRCVRGNVLSVAMAIPLSLLHGNEQDHDTGLARPVWNGLDDGAHDGRDLVATLRPVGHNIALILAQPLCGRYPLASNPRPEQPLRDQNKGIPEITKAPKLSRMPFESILLPSMMCSKRCRRPRYGKCR